MCLNHILGSIRSRILQHICLVVVGSAGLEMTFQLLSWLKIPPLKSSPSPETLLLRLKRLPAQLTSHLCPELGSLLVYSANAQLSLSEVLPFTQLVLQQDIVNISSFKRKTEVRFFKVFARGCHLLAAFCTASKMAAVQFELRNNS